MLTVDDVRMADGTLEPFIDHIICGDCYEAMRYIPPAAVDLVLTDPPYQIGAGGGNLGGQRAYLLNIRKEKLHVGFDAGFLNAFPNWFCFCAKEQLPQLLSMATQNDNWMLLTWNKTNPTPLINKTYLPDTEYIIHSYSKGHLYGEYADKSRFIVSQVEKNAFPHPTVKPLHVISKLIRLGSRPGDIIFDPFLGSGTTAVAAKQLGRHFIGIERDESYCAIAEARLRETENGLSFRDQRRGQMALFTI